MPKDYYLILGVSRSADLKKIKKAYRTIVKKYHPDITRSNKDSEKVIEIREAYEILSDQNKRTEYDRELDRVKDGALITKIPDAVEKSRRIFDRTENLFSTRTDDFLQGFLPGFFDLDKGRIGNKDLFFEATLSLREAAEGGLFPVTIPVLEACPRCGKSGQYEYFLCPVCHGYGRIRSEREFSLSIPPHVKHGTRVRLSLEDIGLRNVYLNVMILIDPDLVETWD
jgi:DnaJ-class molecular chaperone